MRVGLRRCNPGYLLTEIGFAATAIPEVLAAYWALNEAPNGRVCDRFHGYRAEFA